MTKSVLLTGGNLATFETNKPNYGAIKADILVVGDRIVRIFQESQSCQKSLVNQENQANQESLASELPESTEKIDISGRWVLPGFVDAHTHLVFAGSRAAEYERRLLGESYTEIAQSGGGILSTVAATRAASEERLYDLASARLQSWIKEGVTSIEIKSGYGLSFDDEVKMLKVAKRLEEHHPIRVHTSFLAAHAVPKEFLHNSQEYIELIVHSWLPQVAAMGVADSVDVFCESIGFDLAQTEQVLKQAQSLGLGIRAHVEQLSYLGGARLAASYSALSVDHIEYLSQSDCEYLAQSDTVATLLPIAFYHLNETKLPPIAALREAKVPMAVASDFNPGSAPCASLLLALNMSVRLFKLTPEEALRGGTQYAAKALGLSELGQLAEGALADLCVWDIEHPSELAYSYGIHTPLIRCVKGRWYSQSKQSSIVCMQ